MEISSSHSNVLLRPVESIKRATAKSETCVVPSLRRFPLHRYIESGHASLHTMEKIKLHPKCSTQTRSNVVKIVDLKRFMPERDAIFSKRHSFVHISKVNSNNCLPNVNKNVETKNVEVENDEHPLHENEGSNTNKIIEAPETLHNSHSLDQNKTKNICKNKIKFRSCSHTPEELSKLVELHDETLVKVRDMFESREALREYLNEHAKRWFYYYVCRNSKKTTIEFNCMCLNYTPKPRNVVLRRQKKRTTACPCKIRLSIDEATKKLIVYYVCNHHDHKLSEAAFHHYPHVKYLPQQVKDEFLDLAYIGLDVDLIQKYIYSLVGLIIKRKDIWSYAYKFKRKVFKRTLTAERRNYIKELILFIRDTYDDTFDLASIKKSADKDTIAPTTRRKKPELLKRRKSQTKENKESLNDAVPPEDEINLNLDDSNDHIESVLDADYISINHAEVIVQYIDEEGILCDENGTPVTNSSAIMQFITNYEYGMPDTNGKDNNFIEEGTVFSELVENMNDEIYPLDWDSIQEISPVEKLNVDNNESYVEETEGPVSIKEEINKELPDEMLEFENISNREANAIKILSDIVRNCDKRLSPTTESTAVYAEMENFKKYYFVDHQYIKYESEKESQKPVDYKHKLENRQDEFKTTDMVCEEYIKAPEFVYCPTPVKHCTGHEGLVLLTDPDAILPGAKFLMHEVFLTYINERANRWFFYYSLVESGKLPEYYVYKCVYGKHRVSKNAYRSKGLRKRSKLATQCPCQIRLRRLESDPDYLTVLYSCNHHDHVLNAQLFNEQPHSRRLPEHIKEEIKDLLSLGATFDVLRKYVTSETGLKIYDKYFHNVRVKMRKNKEIRRFTDERRAVLTKKLKDLQEIYAYPPKEAPTPHSIKKRTHPSAQNKMEDRFTQDGLDETGTHTQEFYVVPQMGDIGEEICIFQTDLSQLHPLAKRSRLETRLQNISFREDTLLKVRKLQESVRSDHMRPACEIIGVSSI